MAVILDLVGVTKAYDAFKVVDGFNFQVEEGELRCLLGPNGAGKTTTIDLITGRQKTTSGTIVFNGRDITGQREDKIAKQGVGRKFQVPTVFRDLTVRENLQVAFSKNTDPFVNMFRLGRKDGRERLRQVIEIVGLQERLDEQGGNLSHGETQWLEIGMVLTQNPKLLLMDEPTAGMTEQETQKTSEIFNRLKGEHTLVVVEHDMAFVREIADVITLMHLGKTLAEGPMEEVEIDPKVREVYLGSEGITNAA
ncbi:MAG: Lipopolysaccharide export system ATP-binding protein LptB [Alphaproteobacteria bacterium MarineAlpha10_Bin1]|nr:MAG: Lipopolysaccharide export system ATP-binding protein LptB [Alphaproteobacteria bacterium MarineAlpha10_Bin1]